MCSTETRRLRDAANRESSGDFAGAESILREILDDDPDSSGALFALERVLRAQGQIGEILRAGRRASWHSDPRIVGRPLPEAPRVLARCRLAGHARAARREAWVELRADRSEIPYREVARVYERAFGQERGARHATARWPGRGPAARTRWPSIWVTCSPPWVIRRERRGRPSGRRRSETTASQAVTVIRRVQGLSEDVDEAGRAPPGGGSWKRPLTRSDDGGRLHASPSTSPLPEEAMRLTRRGRRTCWTDGPARASSPTPPGEPVTRTWSRSRRGPTTSSAPRTDSSPAERRQFDQRIVDAALSMGDTATALQAQRRIADSFSSRLRGPAARHRSGDPAARLGLAEPERDPAGAARRLPGRVPERARSWTASPPTVASACSAPVGDEEEAAAVLEGIQGPESSLADGLPPVGVRARPGGGDASALLLAVTGTGARESATPVIQFVSLFDRLSEPGRGASRRGGCRSRSAAAHREAAVDPRRRACSGLPAEADRPLLLAEAARIATRGGADGSLAAHRSTGGV